MYTHTLKFKDKISQSKRKELLCDKRFKKCGKTITIDRHC